MADNMWREQILGWRARVGLIFPSTNLLLETALPRMAPEGVTFHFARLSARGSSGADALREMSKRILDAASDLASAEVDLIVNCCTASSFVEGKLHDAHVANEILEATGIRTITTMDAIVRALRHLKVRRLVLVSPYTLELEKLETKYLQEESFEVAASVAMGISDLIALHYPSPAQIYKLARKTWVDGADGILISCNALRAHAIAGALERDLRVPVVTSLTATLWGILRAVSVNDPLPGFGRLLEAS